jgi:hypothetical protein
VINTPMPGVKPYWIAGEVKMILVHDDEALVKVPNGSLYRLTPKTPGIVFKELKVGDKVEVEVTDRLYHCYSARII